MKKLKSAYEIAMEKADKIKEEAGDEGELTLQDEIKPLLARFFKGKINADDLWQELKEKDNESVWKEAQLLILDSLGLRTTEDEFKRRKEGILAIENLKGGQNITRLEQALNQLVALQQKYETDRKKMKDQLEQLMEQKAQMKMRPVQTEDGRTVMKLESDIDEDTKKQFSQKINQVEEMYNERFQMLVEELKSVL